MKFVFHDGGRTAAGYKGSTGDCVTRSIAIVTGRPYQEVYDALNELGRSERISKRKKRDQTAGPGSTGRAISDTSNRSAGTGRQRWQSVRAALCICKPKNSRRGGFWSKCLDI